MLNAEQTLARLHLLASTPWPLSMDTEGEEWMTCIGFSWFSCQCDPHTPREPFKPCPACGVVPFPSNALVIDTLGLKEKPYASTTVDAIRSILEGPMLKVTWAAGHEREFLAWGPKIQLANYEDAMFRWAERWPELRKSLKYAASILTRIPCWTEGIYWDEDDDKPAAAGPLLWRYNCLMKDTLVITEHGNYPIGKLVKERRDWRVLSYNEEKDVVQWRPIVNWFRQPDKKATFLRITIEGNANKMPIVCTPEHKIYTMDEGWILASELKVGDRLLVDECVWPVEQRGALLGTLLGDASIGRTSNPQKSYVTSGHIKRSLPQLKALLFGGTVTGSKKVGGYTGKLTDFWTWYMPACRQTELLRQELSGPTTHRLLNELNSLGLALWFMDDGCRQRQRGKKGRTDTAIFCLQGFTLPERKTIQSWFTDRYGKCYLTTHGSLVLCVEASRRLCQEIGPYVVPDYRYKLPQACSDFDIDQCYRVYSNHPGWDRVAAIEPFTPRKKTRGYKVRYCIEVEDNHNFFTPSGLVANSFDCIATLRLWAHPQLQGLTPRQLERVKMHEEILEATTWASLKGIAYHADRARELREQLEPQVWEAQAAVDAIAGVELPPDERGLLPLVADTLCNKVQMRKALRGYKEKVPMKDEAGNQVLRGGKPRYQHTPVPPRALSWTLCRELHNKDTLPAINRVRDLCSLLPMSPAARAECAALLDLGTNVKSSPAILALLNRLGLPPVFKRGKRKLNPDSPDAEPTKSQSKDADALLALFIKTGHPITTAILRVMSLRGRLQELGRKVGSDGRIRCSYLPGYGAETGRTTSYKFLDGSGGNLQTIPKEPLAGCFFQD